jgi:hypothetical protein
MSRAYKWVAALAAVAIVAVGGYQLGHDLTHHHGQQTVIDNSLGSYPEPLQRQMLAGCDSSVPGSAPTSYCDCALRYVEAHVSLADFVAAADGGTDTPQVAALKRVNRAAGAHCSGG